MSCAAVARPTEPRALDWSTTKRSEPMVQPCYLLSLPDEVKLEIVKHVTRRRDLYHFSLACRSLEDMTLSRLYKSVNLDIPNSMSQNWSQHELPTFRPFVLRNMRELAIRNGISDVKNPVFHRRRTSDANSMEGYVGEIFRGVPKDRLKAFSYLHQSPMSIEILDGLTQQHNGGLKHLQCCELELLTQPEAPIPSNLRSLECRSVLSGEAITKLMEANRGTLRSLTLGQDKYLLQQYRQRRIGFLNNVAQPAQSFFTALQLSTIPNLKSLSLSGIDLTPLIPQTAEEALFLTQLKDLSLESCPNTAQFLETLRETYAHVQTSSSVAPQHRQISMKKFSFRNEFFTNPLRDSLLAFLTSFSGLESLAILVENSTFTTSPSTILQHHGQTLRSLVLESRIQPREHLHIDTSRPLGTGATQQHLWQSTITDICTLCPNLVELGIAYPWSDSTAKSKTAGSFAALKHLKTFHARNFPSSQSLKKLGEARIQQNAQDLLGWCYPGTEHKMPLEHLAIGPTLYSSRWRLGSPSQVDRDNTQTLHPQIRPVHVSQLNGSTDTQQQEGLAQPTLYADLLKQKQNPYALGEHLQTHYFEISTCGMTSVNERHMEEVRGQRGLGGVFESVWLR